MLVGTHEGQIRDATADDRAWVCSTWRDSLFAVMPHSTRRQCHAAANALCDRASVHVVEVLSEPPILVAFAARIDDEIVWLYVSRAFRGLGIARMLAA